MNYSKPTMARRCRRGASTASEPVYGVLYLLPLAKFARLDNSEGKQYDYLWTEVKDTDGNRIPAVTYKVDHAAPEGRPSRPT